MIFIRRIIAPLLACLAFGAPDILARPPKMLDFGFIKYKKTQESLFRDPVRQVVIRADDLLPYAVIFEDRIAFIDGDGKTVAESPLPPAGRVRAGESAHGQFVSIYGNLIGSNLGFFRLFDHKGRLLLSRDSIAYNDRYPVPLPLERSRRLLSVKDGILILTNLDGDTVATKALLNDDSAQDGDILLALRGDRDDFSVVANKFQFPTGKEGELPTIYGFDADLEQTSEASLPYMLISGLGYTPDGKFQWIQGESDTGTTEKIITRTSALPMDKPLKLDEGRIFRLAVRSQDKPNRESSDPSVLALVVPKRSFPVLLGSPDWNPLDTLELSTPVFPWQDIAFAPDGSFALFYNNDVLALWKNESGRLSRMPFPYSFKRCHISKDGKRIALAGDFGFEIYEAVR